VFSLLDGCRELHILVTSRIPLHLSREHEYAVPPLSVPDLKHLPAVERLSQYESVALFINRARAAKADFQVTNDNAPAVVSRDAAADSPPLFAVAVTVVVTAAVMLATAVSVSGKITTRVAVLLGSVPETGTPFAAPVVMNGTIYVGTSDGVFHEISIAS
jgi:hypothetical protein